MKVIIGFSRLISSNYFSDLAINLITARISIFQPLISLAEQALKTMDADKDKEAYSRLVESILPILLAKV